MAITYDKDGAYIEVTDNGVTYRRLIKWEDCLVSVPAVGTEKIDMAYINGSDQLVLVLEDESEITIASVGTGLYLPLAGGTMSGAIDAGNQNITNIAGLAATTLNIRSGGGIVYLGDNVFRVRAHTLGFVTLEGYGSGSYVEHARLAPNNFELKNGLLTGDLAGGGKKITDIEQVSSVTEDLYISMTKADGNMYIDGNRTAANAAGVIYIRTLSATDTQLNRLILSGGVDVAVATWANIVHTGLVLSGDLACSGQKLLNMNLLQLDEIATPSALADHAQLYTKNTNKFFFQDGAGSEHEMSKASELTTHGNLTTAHSAVSAATASRIVVRDASGRSKFAAPNAAGDALIKGTALTITEMPANMKLATITFIIDGGGSAITTGEKGHLEIPFACTINQVTMLADQSGSIVVDIWKDTYANFPPADGDSITASAVPTITTATKSQDSTLSGWTTAITAGDILAFNVDSITTIERLTISLKVTKT